VIVRSETGNWKLDAARTVLDPDEEGPPKSVKKVRLPELALHRVIKLGTGTRPFPNMMMQLSGSRHNHWHCRKNRI